MTRNEEPIETPREPFERFPFFIFPSRDRNIDYIFSICQLILLKIYNRQIELISYSVL